MYIYIKKTHIIYLKSQIFLFFSEAFQKLYIYIYLEA